jgi:hypothetical protein
VGQPVVGEILKEVEELSNPAERVAVTAAPLYSFRTVITTPYAESRVFQTPATAQKKVTVFVANNTYWAFTARALMSSPSAGKMLTELVAWALITVTARPAKAAGRTTAFKVVAIVTTLFISVVNAVAPAWVTVAEAVIAFVTDLA